jgi:hypothetical protein
METITKKLTAIGGILNVSMSSNFAEVLIVSKNEIAIEALQQVISYDEKYKIKKINKQN